MGQSPIPVPESGIRRRGARAVCHTWPSLYEIVRVFSDSCMLSSVRTDQIDRLLIGKRAILYRDVVCILPHRARMFVFSNICMWVMPYRITWMGWANRQFYTSDVVCILSHRARTFAFFNSCILATTVGSNRSAAAAFRQFYTAALFASCRIAQEVFGVETGYCRVFREYYEAIPFRKILEKTFKISLSACSKL
jgi:hypothetical protein